MIVDTWERHLAAVSEARRLIGLVLQNNAAFRAWDNGAPVSEALADDPQFTAFGHLTKALAALQPIPAPGDLPDQPRHRLGDRIAAVTPRLAAAEASIDVPSQDGGLDELRQRLSYVLEEAPEDRETLKAPAQWPGLGEEAEVAIVRSPMRRAAARGAV